MIMLNQAAEMPANPKSWEQYDSDMPQPAKPENTYFIVSFIREIWEALLSDAKDEVYDPMFMNH